MKVNQLGLIFVEMESWDFGSNYYCPCASYQYSKCSESERSPTVKLIGTHNGQFHCDEVLACFMLQLLPEYTNAKIVRTRDAQVLNTCEIVVDVGCIYDPQKLRFDHHQSTFNSSMSSIRPEKPWTTKLSSAGLIFCHFGERILGQMLNKVPQDETIGSIFDQVYENFIEEIDGNDNGINVSDSELKYRISTNISNRVRRLNPSWKEDDPDEWEYFQSAMESVGKEFTAIVNYYATEWWEYLVAVKQAIETRFEVDPSGQVIQLKKRGPWKDHLFHLEKELKLEKEILFVLYGADGKQGHWKFEAVPIKPDSYTSRLPLIEEWRGLCNQELQTKSDILGAEFVHANGFIGGAKDKASALEMIQVTLHDSTNALPSSSIAS